MFESLKHTFQSFEDHLRKLFEHVETKTKAITEATEEALEEQRRKLRDEIETDLVDFRADVRSVMDRLEKLEAVAFDKEATPAPAAKITNPPDHPVIHVPIPDGDHNPEVAALAASHADTLL